LWRSKTVHDRARSQLITNRKSCISFLVLIGTKVDDIEWSRKVKTDIQSLVTKLRFVIYEYMMMIMSGNMNKLVLKANFERMQRKRILYL